MSNIAITNFIFHDATTTVIDGKDYNVNRADSIINIEVNGTATSSTVIFEGKGVSGNWYAIQGVNLSTLDMAIQTTGKGQIWQFSLDGLVGFRTRISSISGGNLTITGRSVK